MTVGVNNISSFSLYQLQAWIDYSTLGHFAFLLSLFFFSVYLLCVHEFLESNQSTSTTTDHVSEKAVEPNTLDIDLLACILSEDHYPHGNPWSPAGILQTPGSWLSFLADRGFY